MVIKVTEGGIGTPGLLEISKHVLFMTKVNDPLLKLPIDRHSSERYRIYCFFLFRGTYRAHFRSNYARSIPNHSEMSLTGVGIKGD